MVLALARDSAESGDAVRVLFWRGDYPKESGIPYIRLESSGRMRGWPRGLLSFLRAFRPEIVHLHGPTAGSIGAVVARLARVPIVIYTDHSPHHSRSHVARVIRRLAGRLPDMNVAISRAVATSLIDHGRLPGSRVRIILNGTPLVEPASPPVGTSRRFVCVANLLPGKGHEMLLRAFASLSDEATLSLVGDGSERQGLVALAQHLGIVERVTFHGWLDDPWSVAHGAWAYVHPARVEGGGLAVMEAMMRGLPVLATATGGVPDFVHNGRTGILVPIDDADSFADSMKQLLTDRGDRARLAVAAREYAVANLAIENTLRSYRDLYDELRLGSINRAADGTS
jgi:glycosyltransferase involved in cell wall biosynthesis